ncbi:hypothetical protein KIN20_019598 [Parelaphostrongylus tenuis]|uniref:Uncharacterized protein n=1 Tax=Parelaphostrongylus tenuis TaxID=148309 RepID=A0AAD5QT27_PARTN|nr:hypothetical protein KIN20_019598 [Parelaphostrongylus tenuis]
MAGRSRERVLTRICNPIKGHLVIENRPALIEAKNYRIEPDSVGSPVTLRRGHTGIDD